MTIAAAILLIAVGAILRFALNVNVQDVSLDTVGLILMIAGVVGLVLALLQEFIWSDRRRGGGDVAVEERREVREPPRR